MFVFMKNDINNIVEITACENSVLVRYADGSYKDFSKLQFV